MKRLEMWMKRDREKRIPKGEYRKGDAGFKGRGKEEAEAVVRQPVPCRAEGTEAPVSYLENIDSRTDSS